MSFRQMFAHRRNFQDDEGSKLCWKIESNVIPSYKSALIVRRSQRHRSSQCWQLDRPDLISNIHKKLNLHRQFRALCSNGGTLCPLDFHKSLHKLIRMCFDQKIHRSKLFPVGDLFLELYSCSGNSLAIFSILLDNHMISTSSIRETGESILYPRNSTAKDHRLAFQYYLDNVSDLRDEEYEWNNGKKLDFMNMEIETGSGLTPLQAAVQKRDPSFLLIVLRYGADPLLNFLTADEDTGPGPVEQLIDDLNGVFLFKNTGFSAETRSKLAAEEEKLWLCFKYIRRTVLSIPVTSSSHVNTMTDDDEIDNVRCVESDTKKALSLHPSIAEKLDMSYFLPTHSLKHTCRCTIRASIRDNPVRVVSIPAAINQLPIPNPLKAYLDLLTD